MVGNIDLFEWGPGAEDQMKMYEKAEEGGLELWHVGRE